jgi:hypothetical protein
MPRMFFTEKLPILTVFYVPKTELIRMSSEQIQPLDFSCQSRRIRDHQNYIFLTVLYLSFKFVDFAFLKLLRQIVFLSVFVFFIVGFEVRCSFPIFVIPLCFDVASLDSMLGWYA